MKRGSFIFYKGFRIDDRRRTMGCYKIRHSDCDSYVVLDFKSLRAAKKFLDGAIK